MKPSPPKPLGPVLATYRNRPLTWREALIGLLAASLVILAPLLYGGWRTQAARRTFGPAVTESWGLPWYGLSGALLLVCLILGIFRIRRARRGVQVFKNGVGIQESPRKKFVYRWEEISGVASATVEDRFLGRTLRNHTRLVLYPSIGKPLRIHPSIPQSEELCARLKARIYPRLLPELRNALNDGSNLYFGPVTINRQKIRLWDTRFPWSQVALVNMSEGYLMVELKSKIVRKIPVGEIPNLELLIQIIQEGVDA